MTNLTAKEMIATIVSSLEKTGRRFAARSKQKVRAAPKKPAARPRSKSKSSRAAAARG
jgi:hypothetical protein